MAIQRGDIYYADLRPVIGSEQGGIRPVSMVATPSRKPASRPEYFILAIEP